MRPLLTLAFTLLLALPAAAQPEGPLTIEKQGSFFIGGREVQSDALSTDLREPVSAGRSGIVPGTVGNRLRLAREGRRAAVPPGDRPRRMGPTRRNRPNGRMHAPLGG